MGFLPQKEASRKGLAVFLHFGKIRFLPLVIPLIQLSAESICSKDLTYKLKGNLILKHQKQWLLQATP